MNKSLSADETSVLEKIGHIMNESRRLTEDNMALKRTLCDCVNELCLKCGRYEHAFEGSCDGCRWEKERNELEQ